MPERLRILTWHVHGNYLYYLSQVPHDFHVVTKPGYPPGYAGVGGQLPWGGNVHEVPHDRVRETAFDCVLYQHRDHWASDREMLLSPAQRRLPTIYLEHDPPQEHPTNTRHPVQDPNVLLVHVTPFNALMWDSGVTPVRVIDHGVVVDPSVRYTGQLARGISVVNHLARRGRRLGADVFDHARRHVALDLVGMDARASGGIGEVANPELAAFMARYRFFFHPIRYTSLGLAVVEAMTIGMPVVGLATTELATVIRNGVNGYVDTRVEGLVDAMRGLIEDPRMAERWGRAAARTAQERFGIGRFVADWQDALHEVTR
ncbi:glycosyltransferase [Cupriavidus agavae]|uniref:Glycosyl transferase family 1 n=1 Tax=Cupriavidus agavae TaxID=1001822 RepID=A0A4Q7S7U2_9BURK|nr:glycosyltransferase family 4 protein [Cupriavidus agavae]RZT42476.1 glycosyl transferase family 1 [Cupriavidus agavae]